MPSNFIFTHRRWLVSLGLLVLWMALRDAVVNFRIIQLLVFGGRDGLDNQLGSGELVVRVAVLIGRKLHKVPV